MTTIFGMTMGPLSNGKSVKEEEEAVGAGMGVTTVAADVADVADVADLFLNRSE